ncbi:unnamed protein product [Closterium sp. Naga37s-1]|nr:unnamed protein product [Closterium sp. Naga37s-1]
MSTAQLKQWLLDQGVDLSPREHKRAYYLRMALPLLASPGAPLSFASPQLGSLNTLFSPPMGSPDTRAPLNTPFAPPRGSVHGDAFASARSGEPLSAVDQQQRRGKLQEGGKSTPSTAGSACATAGHKRAVEAAAGATGRREREDEACAGVYDKKEHMFQPGEQQQEQQPQQGNRQHQWRVQQHHQRQQQQQQQQHQQKEEESDTISYFSALDFPHIPPHGLTRGLNPDTEQHRRHVRGSAWAGSNGGNGDGGEASAGVGAAGGDGGDGNVETRDGTWGWFWGRTQGGRVVHRGKAKGKK